MNGGPPPSFGGDDRATRGMVMQHSEGIDPGANGMLASSQGMMNGRQPQQQGMQQPGMSMQQQLPYGGGGGGIGEPPQSGNGAPQGLMALLQQQQQQQQQGGGGQQPHGQQQMGMMGGGGGGPPLTPRSLSAHLANGLTGPLGQLTAGGAINEAQLADLTAVINHLEKRQRVGEGPGGPPRGAMQLLSDVADLDKLAQENAGLREELRLMQVKVGRGAAGNVSLFSARASVTDCVHV
jgi:hypothetical protein